jgi:hypothetical protein
MRKFFQFDRYTNKVYLRIGRLIVEAGWYHGETPGVCFKVFEWFPHAGEIVLVWVQMAKAILCVSWDYGR